MRTTFLRQESLITDRSYRRGISFFFIYVGLITLVYGVLTAKFYRSWTISDWLINYEGGFVRRGLPGQVAYDLGHLLHLAPVIFVVLFYLSCYAVLLVAGRALALRARPSWWCLALLLSPATFSFQILDATAGFRKEILYLSALAVFAILLQRTRLSSIAMSALLTLVITVEVLSHEPLICYVPYFFALLLVSGRTFKQSSREFAFPLLAGLAAAFISSRHLGSLSTASQICSSLGYSLRAQGKEICSGGAMQYLTFSPALARATTWLRVRDDYYLVLYPFATALALLPLVLGSLSLSHSGKQREVRALWGVAAISFFASLLLFVYAEDWGRWIYIHVMSISILLLCLDGQLRSQAKQIASMPRNKTALWALAAYATLWTLPHVPSMRLPFGYLGLAYDGLRRVHVL